MGTPPACPSPQGSKEIRFETRSKLEAQRLVLRIRRCAVAVAGAPSALLAQPAYPSARASSVDPTSDLPAPLRGIGIDQRLGDHMPLDTAFRDEAGRAVRLRDYFGSKPVLLSLAYFECPMLCTQVLNGLVSSLRPLTFDVGKEFTVLTVSFDARDTAEAAATKKAAYL